MRSFLALVATAIYVAAVPAPQVMDFDALLDMYPTFAVTGAPLAATATATTVPFNAATASAAAAAVAIETVGATQPTVVADADMLSSDDENLVEKRSTSSFAKRDGNCSLQKTISTYTLGSSSTVSEFYDQLSALGTANSYTDGFNAYTVATKADGSSPWLNLKGASSAPGYLGYTSQKTYDPAACLAACEKQAAGAKVGNKCVAFNLYIERDPSLDTNAVSCPNPAPITNVKCVLYSQALSPESAKNTGQWRNKFQVAIASSSAYNKATTPLIVTGFATPAALPGAINAPLDAANGNIDTYMGTASFTTADPNNCAKACDAKTANEKSYWEQKQPGHTYQTCNYFNYYILSKNGVPVQQVCSFYSAPWDPSYAVNTGYTSGSSVYTISSSAGYTKPSVVRTDIRKGSRMTATFASISDDDYAARIFDNNLATQLFTYQGLKTDATWQIWKPYSYSYPLATQATSRFAGCDKWHTCEISLPGSTFDLISLDLADIYLISGDVTVAGVRRGAEVLERTFNLPGDKFTHVTDFAGFTNLDAIRVYGAGENSMPVFQNLVYDAYQNLP